MAVPELNFYQYIELLDREREPIEYVTTTTVCGGSREWFWINYNDAYRPKEMLPAVAVDISRIL
jgi:hypothetical protein